ncbi:MAG: class I SAM-dependent methyltransferase [Acidobacteriota bacterium]
MLVWWAIPFLFIGVGLFAQPRSDLVRAVHLERSQRSLDYEIVKLFKNPLAPGNCFYGQLLEDAKEKGIDRAEELLAFLDQLLHSLDEDSYELRFKATWAALTNSECPDSEPARILKQYLESRGVNTAEPRSVVEYVEKVAEDYDQQFLAESEELAGVDGTRNRIGLRAGSGLYITSIFDAAFRVDRLLGELRLSKNVSPMRRVLIVGPGLNIVDQFLGTQVPVSSPQPLCLLESLWAYQLADLGIRIDLLDINTHVIDYWLRSKEKSEYRLLGYLAYSKEYEDLSAHTRRYLESFGTRCSGVARELFANRQPLQAILWKDPRRGLMFVRSGTEGIYFRDLLVSRRAFSFFSAQLGDIVTDRVADRSTYDLVVSTNVLLYFDAKETTLAVANMARCLKEGGYLIVTEDLEALVPERYSLRRIRKDVLGDLVPPAAQVPAFFLYQKVRTGVARKDASEDSDDRRQ